MSSYINTSVSILRKAELLHGSKPILAELVEKGEIKIVGERYDLVTGAVELVK